MKIIMEVSGDLTQDEIKLYLKEIKFDFEFLKSITFEQSEDDRQEGMI